MDLLNQLTIARAITLFPRTKLDANCLASDLVGNCVFITGAALGDIYQVTTADPLDGAFKMPSLGVIVSKSTPTRCVVQVSGEMKGVVTGLTPNKVVFVNTDGSLTHTPPLPATPGQLAYIESMGIAISTDRVLIMPDFSVIKRLG